MRALIDREGPLRPARVVSIVTQIASALDTAHANGLVHRDVKPANMLLGTVATRVGARPRLPVRLRAQQDVVAAVSLTGTGQFLGTLDYMSPEQVEGRPIDGRTDLYALACAAFEMLTGRPPFQRDQDLAVMWAQVSAPPPSVLDFRRELPADVDRVIAKALAKAPDDRHATCLEFAADLRAACLARPGRGQAGPARRPVPTELAGAVRQLRRSGTGAAGGLAPGDAGSRSEATITEAAIGGDCAGGAARAAAGVRRRPGAAAPRRPTSTAAAPTASRAGYQQQSGYGQGGYGQGGYGAPGRTDQRWRRLRVPAAAVPGPPPRRRGKALPILLGVLVLAVLGGAAALVLHLRGNGNPHTGPTDAGHDHQARPARSAAARHRSSASGSPGSPTAPASPDTVVTDYYTAINNHDYRTAYRLNEQEQSLESFATFKQGFAGTQHDDLTITGVIGDTVSFDLTADQTDGSVKTYQGTYTVQNGKITGSSVTQTG